MTLTTWRSRIVRSRPGEREEGPAVTLTKPTTCKGCKWLVMSMRVHSRLGPNVYQYYCTHQSAYPPKVTGKARPRDERLFAGRGTDVVTPSWCPVLSGHGQQQEVSNV